jgi:capsular exopolysaccharide synthesis family protein
MIKQNMNAFNVQEFQHQRPQYHPQPQQLPSYDEAPEQDFDMRSIFRVLIVRAWTILGVIAICMSIAVVVMFQITPVYNSSALIMVGQRENKVLDSESVIAELQTDASTLENQIQVLKSWSLAEKVILKFNLTHDPEFNTALSKRSIYNVASWFQSSAPKKKIVAPKGAENLSVKPGVLAQFASKLSVSTQGRSSVIKVTFESSTREKAAKLANAVADQYMIDQLDTKFDAAKRTTDWLNGRLQQLADKVRLSENAVEQYKADHGLADGKAGGSLAGEQMSELNGQIALARSKLAEQEAKYKQVVTMLKQGGSVDSIAAVINSPLIGALRTQQADLMRKEAELSTKYGARHPQMVALQDEKTNLQAKIDEEVKRISKNLANEVSVARASLKSLSESMSEIQGTANTQGQASVRLRELERDAQANRTLYDTFQSRFKASEDRGQIQTADARVIQKAAVPGGPSFPNRPLIMGASLAGSTILGLLIAFMLERMDNSFRTGAEIERTLRLANLSVVPMLPKVKLVADRIVQKPLSAFSESIRSLYSALQLSNVDRPPKVIVITSSVPNEGKTSIAVSLGRLAAKSGQRVLLIDGDLRHPSVGRQFSPRQPDAGLVEVLAGRRDLAHVIHRDPISPLEFVPVAVPPANPADLLASQSMRRLIEVLRRHYDLVIIDAAPVLPVADTRLLARIADKMVYVVRWDSTPREAVMSGVKLLREAHADIAGVVLNQADMRKHALYGYGYTSYGYGNKYTRYYSD